jgi:hypothetical protein
MWLREAQDYCRRWLSSGGPRGSPPEAWTRFYQVCARLVSGLVARYPLGPAEAQDVKQLVWLEILLSGPFHK